MADALVAGEMFDTKNRLVSDAAEKARQRPGEIVEKGPSEDAPKRSVDAKVEAAAILGGVYRKAADNNILPLGDWAKPPADRRPPSRLMIALGRGDPAKRYETAQTYFAAYELLVPRIERIALKWAVSTMRNQRLNLLLLEQDVVDRADELHEAAERVVEAIPGLYTPNQPLPIKKGERSDEYAERSQRVSMARALPLGDDVTLNTLFAHPKGYYIIRTLADDRDEGVVKARRYLAAARAATGEFQATLDLKKIWRFPPALVAATSELDILEVDGMPEFAVSLGMLLGKSWWDSALDHAADAVMAIELGGGPIGVAVAEILDVVLSGLQWLSDFFQAVDADAAALATDFAAAHERMGQRMSGLKQAATLLGSVGLAAAPYIPGGSKRIKGLIPDRTFELGDAIPVKIHSGGGAAAAAIAEDAIAAEKRGVSLAGGAPTPKLPVTGAVSAAAAAADTPLKKVSAAIEEQLAKKYGSNALRKTGTAPLPGTSGSGNIKLISVSKVNGAETVVIHGDLQPGRLARKGKPKTGQLKAPNFNSDKKLIRPQGDLGPEFKDYQWAHLWGPGLGDEASAGMWLADTSVNTGIQHVGEFGGIEAMAEQIAEVAEMAGGKAVLTVKGTAFKDLPHTMTKGAQFLETAKYEVTVIRPDGKTFTWKAEITCARPPAKTARSSFDADDISAFVERIYRK
jgi:hypothetical protein